MNIVIMAVGPMGVGKTKTIVDMALSYQVQFREKALELMDRNIMRYPEFNFSEFEKSLAELIKLRKLKNLATCRRYINEVERQFRAEPSEELLWGYDYKSCKMRYNNGVTSDSIWSMLRNYAQEYFIYTMLTSTLISNIAIRSDIEVIDKGYFKLFNDDFFKRDPEKLEDYSVYSHIIDFDLFRVGCQMCKENHISGSFEFGVILVSEIGKERKNALELKETKAKTDEANQKNDLFNEWLKMIRHAATVEGYCFVRFLCDEQRPESWGADARDLCTILHIESVSEVQCSLRFCFFSYFFTKVFLPEYYKWYNKVKHHGNENHYAVQVCHAILSNVYAKCDYKLNFYGYLVQQIGEEAGTMTDEALEIHKYYLMYKKIYARRYATDAFKGALENKALVSGTSLYTIPTYQTVSASLAELKLQNSYMANSFIKMYYNSKA